MAPALTSARIRQISDWIDQQFETGNPLELSAPPRIDGVRHFRTDPGSGVSGEAFLADVVYYRGLPWKAVEPWWDLGPLPDNLAAPAPMAKGAADDFTEEALKAIARYFADGGEGVTVVMAYLADCVTGTPWIGSGSSSGLNPSGQLGALNVSATAAAPDGSPSFVLGIAIELDTGTGTAHVRDPQGDDSDESFRLRLVAQSQRHGGSFVFAVESTGTAVYQYLRLTLI